MSTAGRSMALALRMRVSISAMGSVIIGAALSPARLLDPGDEAVAGHVAEADPADAELAVDVSPPAAQLAAQPNADHVPRLHLGLGRVTPAGLELGQLPSKLDVLRFGS